MIVREIKNNPDKMLENFDYFNDYEDTAQWAKHNCPEILPELQKRNAEFLENRKRKILTDIAIYS